MSDLVKRLDFLHSDLQGRVDAPKLQLIEEAKARIETLEAAGKAAAHELRIIAGMDLMGASAAAWNTARALEAALAAGETP
jgi:hypothetical protein